MVIPFQNNCTTDKTNQRIDLFNPYVYIIMASTSLLESQITIYIIVVMLRMKRILTVD